MLVGQFSPGPDFLLVLKNALNHGRRAAMFSVAGIALGLAVHTGIALAGLTVLFHSNAAAGQILRYAGAAYLAYLGIKLLLARPANGDAASGSALGDRSAFAQGLLTNLLNPKVVLFISAMLAQFLEPDSPPIDRWVYAAIIVLQGGLMWAIFAQLLQARRIRQLFLTYQVLFNQTFALFLLALAVRATLP